MDSLEFIIRTDAVPPPPPPPPPDFETLWPPLIHIAGSILAGTVAISVTTA